MIRYPGRDAITAEKFANNCRPDFSTHKICDLNLSAGSLLYHCSPCGWGFTREKHIIELHQFFQVRSCISYLKRCWEEDFKSGQSEQAYLKQRSLFNSKRPRIQNWSDCARLYCLLTASGYAYKYSNKAYSASYFPYSLDLNDLQEKSNLAREKNPSLVSGDLLTFDDSKLSNDVVAYFHMPGRFDRYGYNYVWSRRKMNHVVKAFNELNVLGYKVCLSTLYESRGLKVHNTDLFPDFGRHVVIHSDDVKYGFNRRTSEIYYVNF